MWIKNLTVHNFRNLEDHELAFERKLNWLVGPNGQGKTNCLEAAYFVLTTKSFRTHRLADLFRVPSQAVQLQADLMKVENRTQFAVRLEKGKTQRFLGEKACSAMSFFENGAVISFTARSKALVEGQPEDRRRFLDRMMAYLDLRHISLMSRYRKIRAQLAKIMYGSGNLAVYKGFKNTIVPLAHQIVRNRTAFLEDIRQETERIFTSVFQGEGELVFQYHIKNGGTLEQYPQKMMDVCAAELLYRKTQLGPHLDDLEIALKDRRAKRIASSGQVRAIVLSLKLAVRETYFKRYGFYPILLLDDIDAELDGSRLKNLLNYLDTRGQTLISTSKYDTITGRRKDRLCTVNAGRISPERTVE